MSLESGPRFEQDVLVGAVLLQVEPLLFPEDQETEEGFGSLGTRDAITQRFQAEGGVPVALDKPEGRILEKEPEEPSIQRYT